jgi:CubicO group peptidase (beta-lactamase class C family)
MPLTTLPRPSVRLAIAGAACLAVLAPSSAQADTNPGSWTFTEVTDANVAKAVAQLPDIIEEVRAKTGVPGFAAAVVYQGRVLLADGYGERAAGSRQPVDANTVFQMASVSKAVGATAVSRLVDEGVISWDDPVRDHIPGFALATPYVSRNATIADLYSHRSGLPLHAGDDLEDIGFDRAAILERLRYLPLTSFRDTYHYTNFGLTAGAQAAADAARMSWVELTDTKLFQPAGMTSSSFLFSDYLNAPNRALTHVKTATGWQHGETRNPQAQSPAGGLSSTANDMARWMLLQLGDGAIDGQRLIDAGVLQVMRQPHSVSGAPANPDVRPGLYGYGIGTGVDGTGHVKWSHSGAFFLGTGTVFEMLPAADLGIVVMGNVQPMGYVEAISASFMDIATTGSVQRDWLSAYTAVFAPMLQDPSELAGREPASDAKPRLPLSAYVGEYRNDYVGTARVERKGSGLVLRLGPEGRQGRYPLTAWGGNLFSYLPRGENALGPSAVTFRPAEGTVTIEQLDENGMGTLTRVP